MKLLLHPLAIPLYTFLLYMEIERQSYVVDYMSVIWLLALLLLSMLCANMLPYWSTQGKSPLVDVHSPILAKTVTAVAMIISFVTATIAINALGTYTKGAKAILPIYIFPTILNIMSGDAAARIAPRLSGTLVAKCNAAPASFIGALSGFTIMIGYKTSTDTFWPFVISLLMIALRATLHKTDDENTPQTNTAQLTWYIIGIAQAVALMCWDF